ncbi:MAG TPA: 4'-phosphopantetheinyl transferase superfamily protein [Planctomycetota bacterium]|nr:4'-phosphopantetheinyl transferase superfamily protein [Planctomycetota bacterium]
MWRASLERDAEGLEEAASTLSREETARARSFVAREKGDLYTAGRAVLRRILGGYLQVEPRDVEIACSPGGKPCLGGRSAGRGIRFNVSHTGPLALYAVARGREVGIDVERVRADLGGEGMEGHEDIAGEDIARRFFSPREVESLRALPREVRREGFFACWTRKESYVKAIGEGLAVGLDLFDVTVSPLEPPALLASRWRPDDAARWSLLDLDLGPGHRAALAVEGTGWRLSSWDWIPLPRVCP